MSAKVLKWLPIFHIQFFADGGASGSGGDGGGDGGADSGVSAGAADRSLEDLGVPPEKAERFRQRKAKRQPPVIEDEEPVTEPEPVEEAAPAAMGWDDFMQIPENQQRLQAMMADRGKKATEAKQAAEATMQKLNPALELIAARYGIQAVDGQFDIDAITNAITNDDSYYEQRAEEMGVDVEVAKQLEQANMERKRAEAREQALRAQQEKADREFQLRQHFNKMQQEAVKLKELFPDFDLQRELANPVFFQRTAPGPNSMSVEDAFYSMHHNEILQGQVESLARRIKADAGANIRSGVRPKENGSSSTAAVSATPNIKQMTREERRAYIRQKYGAP